MTEHSSMCELECPIRTSTSVPPGLHQGGSSTFRLTAAASVQQAASSARSEALLVYPFRAQPAFREPAEVRVPRELASFPARAALVLAWAAAPACRFRARVALESSVALALAVRGSPQV